MYSAILTVMSLSAFSGGPALAIEIVRGPIIQQTGSSTVVIAWETDLPASGKVLWGEVGKLDRIAESPAVSTRHEVPLAGLVPGAQISYRVCAGTRHSRVRTFTAPPSPGQDVSIVMFGDTRSIHKSHRAVIDEAASRPAHYCLNTGDMVEHGDSMAQWDAFFAVEEPLLGSRISLHVLGNHDLVGKGIDLFTRLFVLPPTEHAPERDWVIDAGKVRIVGLDNFVTSKSGPAQKAWLEKVLVAGKDAAGIEHTIVAVHQGINSNGPHGPSKSLLAAGLDDVMRAHGVDLVIAGHDHSYERGVVDGLRYMITAGGGAPLYSKTVKRGFMLKREIVHHFVAFVTSGKELAFDVVLTDGSVLESCRLVPGPKAYDCK